MADFRLWLLSDASSTSPGVLLWPEAGFGVGAPMGFGVGVRALQSSIRYKKKLPAEIGATTPCSSIFICGEKMRPGLTNAD